MKPKLSILICTIPSRYAMLKKLHSELYPQLSSEVEVLLDDRKSVTVGEKRNSLLSAAKGEYVAYIDDDDMISENYIKLLMQGINSGCDCSSLKGIITFNGNNPAIFEHSIKFYKWETTNGEIKYLRFPNHLNCIKAGIAKQFSFPEVSYGEDYKWSEKIHNSRLLKTEYYIPDILYYYRKVLNK